MKDVVDFGVGFDFGYDGKREKSVPTSYCPVANLVLISE